MIAPKEKPVIEGEMDGNAFFIIGTIKKALKRAGADDEYIEKYATEATSGDYDHLLQVSMEYAEF